MIFGRLLRRPSAGFFRDTLHVGMIGSVVVFALLFSKPISDFAFKSAFIDLRSVTVADDFEGENPAIEVDRVIARDFTGSFSVTIRRAIDERPICLITWPTFFNYRKAASKENPIVTDLLEWVGDRRQLAECLAERRFGRGAYYLETCHRSLLFEIWVLRRCVDSNIFLRK